MEISNKTTPCIYDAHCHIHETPDNLNVLEKETVVFCVQATKYTDWNDVARLKDQHGWRVIPAFGVHPWFAGRVQTGEIPSEWHTKLRQMLELYGGGIVGECGLDKVAKDPETGKAYPFAPQIQLLKKQLLIAHEMGVPISLHCVRAFGTLFEVLKEAESKGTLPPRIMLHSYSGSPDMLKQVLLKGKLGKHVYVSVSWFVNGRNTLKSKECIAAVPECRLLVESDLHDAKEALPALERIIGFVAEVRGWTLQEARSKLMANSRAFFNIDSRNSI